MKRLRQDKRGVSNVIVVMLSLVLVVIIVGNVILWSYEMNQLDWERIEERIALTNAEQMIRSTWFPSGCEYTTNSENRVNRTYTDTWAVNGSYETFKESEHESRDSYGLDIEGGFTVDLSTYPRDYTESVEIVVRYRTSDTLERWFIKAYEWTWKTYSDVGFNTTAGDSPATEFKYYAVNLTTVWQDYVQTNGTIRMKFCDANPDADQTTVDIDFIGVRLVIEGTKLSLRNDGSVTCHVVAVWILNATWHERYTADLFFNAGISTDYIRADIPLPEGKYIAKVVTERGNIALFAKN
jgi:hypothetical protein